jgi:hypothetical protein
MVFFKAAVFRLRHGHCSVLDCVGTAAWAAVLEMQCLQLTFLFQQGVELVFGLHVRRVSISRTERATQDRQVLER